MKIAPKLWLGFATVLTLTAILGAFCLVQMSKLNANVLDIGTNWMASITYISQLRFDTSKLRRMELNYFLTADRLETQTRIDETMSKILEDEKLYEPTIASEEERHLYQGFRAEWDKHLAVKDRIGEFLRQGKEKEAGALSTSEGKSTYAAADQFLADDVELNIKGGADATKSAAATYSSSRYWVVGMLAGAITLGLLIATGIARSLSRAALRMLATIQAVAANNLTVEDMKITSEDEIGQAGVALNGMKNSLHEMIQSIAGSALQVGSASEELNTTSQQITANSEETSAQADVVSKAAQAVSQNLQTVATGAEEMGASIKEIAKNATEAAKVATSAVRVAEATTATVSKLGESSNEIGQVIKVITSIAQQTNLLALNATIEAARAGEAGKGFAVVANEVKELAKETARATEDISRKIEAIQSDTKAAVDAIASISGVITQINDISGTIATAVEEQNATTNEMSRNVTEAAHGSGEITSNIGGVADAAQSTTRGATDTQKASQQLVETSAQLRRLVEQFKINVGNRREEGATADQTRNKAAHAGA
ncbi:MAG TPA: methyl-accepting chemotaxis protein [Terriglobales bacterium]|nr:methyl-accepting chemotaxis protein [Terriglobales bacterium]